MVNILLNVSQRIADKIWVDEEGCWLWCGAQSSKEGLARCRVGDRVVWAHKYLYEQLRNKIPDGHRLKRTCREPTEVCVNPFHHEVRGRW